MRHDVPAVDPHVHVGQVGEGDDASGEEPGPVDVVVHVVWVDPNQETHDHNHLQSLITQQCLNKVFRC